MGVPQHQQGLNRNGLVLYTAACRALAAARTTDEVRKIKNNAAMLRAYAKQAQNKTLEIDAAEIRIRAERRLGELIAAQKQTVGLAKGKAGPGRGKAGAKAGPAFTDAPTLADAGIDKHLAQRARDLAKIPTERFEGLVETWRDRTERNGERVSSDLLRSDKLNVHHSSESPEHYTPQSLLVSVRAVLGEIDLDPCSNSHDTPNVGAQQHFTSADDGLQRPWHGRVFINPPYGREIAAWAAKIRTEWQRGEVTELIALIPARTDTEWFDALTRDIDDLVACCLFGRLTFIGNDDPAPFPSMLLYFGPKHDVFARVFVNDGSLWQRPSRPLEWFLNHD